jgi:Membrane proteins related to metalloendopeptidases
MNLPYKAGSTVRVTSLYGTRTLNGVTAMHNGIDLVGSDKNIIANVDGKVIQSRIVTDKTNLTWQWGNYITIQDNNGYQHIYAHLNARHVKIGDIVKVGQIIGVEGNTGYSFGSHLHYEVRTSGNVAIDPTPFLGIPNIVGSYTIENKYENESEEEKMSYETFKEYQDRYRKELQAAKPSDWAKEDWELAVEMGITDGTRPRDTITREEALILTKRLLGNAKSELK